MQNAFPPYPIVIDTLMNFQYEGQLSFIKQMNQKGIRSLLFTMNLVHFKFLGASLHGTLNHGVSVALSEPN